MKTPSLLTKSFAVTALALTLAGCDRESASDKARKPDAAEAAIRESVANCETGPLHGAHAAYAERLRGVLMDARTASLDLLNQNHITICLDQRLSHQEKGFFDHGLEGIYYSKDSDGGTLALWDNGKHPGFYHKGAKAMGGASINHFAKLVRENEEEVSPLRQNWYARTVSCGKNCWTTEWLSKDEFDKDTIRKNPFLVQTPPLREVAAP